MFQYIKQMLQTVLQSALQAALKTAWQYLPLPIKPSQPVELPWNGTVTIVALMKEDFFSPEQKHTRKLLTTLAKSGAQVIYKHLGGIQTSLDTSLHQPYLDLPNLKIALPNTDIRPFLKGRFLLWTNDAAQHRNLDLIRPQLVIFESNGDVESVDFQAMCAKADLIFAGDRTFLTYHDHKAMVLLPDDPNTLLHAVIRIENTPNRKTPRM